MSLDDGPSLTSKDVRAATGATYRQINDWDERGALGSDREGERGWRRMSPRDVFVLMVMREIRQRFGVPVAKLKFIRDYMTQEGANHAAAAVALMIALGTSVWLLTDFEDTFIIDSEYEFRDMFENGHLNGFAERGFVFLELSPLVNRLLEALGKDPIKPHRGFHMFMHELRHGDPSERAVLGMLRDPKLQKVEVKLTNGRIETVTTTDWPDRQADIVALIESEPFQRVEITTRDGSIATIKRTRTTKFDSTGQG